MKIPGLRLATVGVAAVGLAAMTACSSGLGGSSGSSGAAGGAGGGGTLSLLVGNDERAVAAAKSVVAAFEKANPGVTVKTETRPGGAPGGNPGKTKRSKGGRQDGFRDHGGGL